MLPNLDRRRHLRDPKRALTIADLREAALRRLPGFAAEYLEGGAEEERTLRRNRAIFDALRFVPRTLIDISGRGIEASLWGRPLGMPVVVAPTGLAGLLWPGADLHLAAAAAGAGIPFTQSTVSNTRIERITDSYPGARHWLQLYVFGPETVQDSLIARALLAGTEALVVTTDTPVYGNREWDRRNYARPLVFTWRAKLDALAHPRWLADVIRHGFPRFENLDEFLPEGSRGLFAASRWIVSQYDAALTWEKLQRLRRVWPRRLLVKGVLSADDALRAQALGADGVVLSNHGGRQLDGAVSAMEILAETRRAVGPGFTVLVDGGFRRGTEIVAALCLGADAVMLGRAPAYGVAAAGAAGAARALAILREEIDRTLALLGCTSLAELGPHLLRGDPALLPPVDAATTRMEAPRDLPSPDPALPSRAEASTALALPAAVELTSSVDEDEPGRQAERRRDAEREAGDLRQHGAASA